MQFYPGDWRRDVELRSCSVAARGLWIDLMCLAHECQPYGHLVVNGKPMTVAQMAGQIGLTAVECKKLLQELIDNGVARVDERGAIFSQRMVRDEQVRNARAEGGKSGAAHGAKGALHGSKGGRPRKESAPGEPPSWLDGEPPSWLDGEPPSKPPFDPPSKPPPSSSSSSSIQERGARSESAPPARAHEEPPTPPPPAPPATAAPPPVTPAGQACIAIRKAGLAGANPQHPDLLRLLAAGVTPEVFGETAAELAKAGKARFALLLATVEGRLRDAAARGAPPAAPERPWDADRAGIEAMGARLGLGRWDEAAFSRSRSAEESTARSFAAYTARVRRAHANHGSGGLPP